MNSSLEQPQSGTELTLKQWVKHVPRETKKVQKCYQFGR